jgi:hypothetical protein
MNSYNAFPKEKIIEHANAELAASGSKIKVVDINKVKENVATAVTNRGGLLVLIMVSYSSLSIMGFRAIHRINNKRNSYSFLFNGQPCRNLTQLVFNGESGTRYYASASDTSSFFKEMYSQIKEESERLVQVNRRVSWEAKNNPVIQNDLLSAFTCVAVVKKAHDYSPIAEFESAVLFSLCEYTGKVLSKTVGELNLLELAKIVTAQPFFLTKVDIRDSADEKKVNVAMARCLWQMLGNVPVNDDGDEIDEDFLHFTKGHETDDIWHWFEENFDVCLAIDLINGGQSQEVAS